MLSGIYLSWKCSVCRFIYWFCHVVVCRAAVKRYSPRVRRSGVD